MYFHNHPKKVSKSSLTAFNEKLLRLNTINGMDQAVVYYIVKENIDGEPNA